MYVYIYMHSMHNDGFESLKSCIILDIHTHIYIEGEGEGEDGEGEGEGEGEGFQ